MRGRSRYAAVLFGLSAAALVALAARLAAEPNFGDRRALVVASCPFVELGSFAFHNVFDGRAWRFEQAIGWRNTGPQALVAAEVVILRYDAYNRPEPPVEWDLNGHGGDDWKPLNPGESGRDATQALGQDASYTEIAWVRSARLGDGTVWEANQAEVLREAHHLAPDIHDLGELSRAARHDGQP
jgi:hypothetical protein